jgi:site-specific recombinase XerD
MKKIIEPYNNKIEDLLFWLKDYLCTKIYSLTPTKGKNEIFQENREKYYNLVYDSISFEELRLNTKIIANGGLSNIKTYTVPLYAFFKYMVEKKKKVESIKEIDTDVVNTYALLEYKNLKENTKRVYYIQLRSFFKYIDERSHDDENFRFNIGELRDGTKAKNPVKITATKTFNFLEPEDFETFIKSIKTYKSKRTDVFNQRLMVKFFALGGLRSTEARFLKKNDCTIKEVLSEKYLQLHISGKVGHERFICIKYDYIKEDYEKTLELNSYCDWLFYSRENKQYEQKATYNLVKRFYKHAGVEEHGIHGLRTSWATYLHSKGVSLDIVIILLGHISDEVQNLYVYADKQNINKIPNLLENI